MILRDLSRPVAAANQTMLSVVLDRYAAVMKVLLTYTSAMLVNIDGCDKVTVYKSNAD